MRALLMETAHRLIRTDERWTALAARLSNRGKPKSVIVAAVAKFVGWLVSTYGPQPKTVQRPKRTRTIKPMGHHPLSKPEDTTPGGIRRGPQDQL